MKQRLKKLTTLFILFLLISLLLKPAFIFATSIPETPEQPNTDEVLLSEFPTNTPDPSEDIDSNNSDFDKSETQTISAFDMDVRLLGRTFYDDENDILYFNNTCSGIEFYFTGKSLDALLVTDDTYVSKPKKQAWIAVYLDDEEDEPYKRFSLDESEAVYNIFSSEETQTVKIKISKLSEAAFGKAGIQAFYTDPFASLEASEEKSFKIEFIGDSYTCGYGNEGSSFDTFTTAQENGEQTYAAQTARYFDADYNIIARSGIGIISTNKKDTTLENLMPFRYQYTDYFLQQALDITPYEKWDNSNFEADLIVVNLGINDSKYIGYNQTKLNQFGKAYNKFIAQIREANPDAYILCVIREDKPSLYKQIENCVALYHKNKDKNISAMTLPIATRKEGYGTAKHPTIQTHERMADVLIERIEAILGW